MIRLQRPRRRRGAGPNTASTAMKLTSPRRELTVRFRLPDVIAAEVPAGTPVEPAGADADEAADDTRCRFLPLELAELAVRPNCESRPRDWARCRAGFKTSEPS